MESAAEYLRDMAEAMADGPLESAVSTIVRLEQIADDLDALLGSPLPPPWGSKGHSAEQRLRNGGVA
jgi:hypothetical protein